MSGASIAALLATFICWHRSRLQSLRLLCREAVAAGGLYAGLFLDLDAFAEWDFVAEQDLFTIGLPGISIPDVLSLGPEPALGISAELDIQPEGQYLAGIS